MLEKVVLDRELSKEEYKARLPALEMELFDLERRAKAAGIATVIVFEGWETAGKGSTLRVLTERLDPRHLRIHAVEDPQPHEEERPWMWRFWMKLPNDGEMAIFDTSWYRHVLRERMDGRVKRREFEIACQEINEFEHQLADDGHVLMKFFLHISKKEQKRRLKKGAKDPNDFFEPTPEMWRQNRNYEKWLRATEEMLERTETEWAPWTIVEATDRRFARIKVFETVVAALRERLARTPNAPPPLFLPGELPAPKAAIAGNGGVLDAKRKRGGGRAAPSADGARRRGSGRRK
jgi:polyphosphate kinase 2 (PPK2 family)